MIRGAEPWEEDRWRVLEMGEARVHLVKPCARCTVTLVDQGDNPLVQVTTDGSGFFQMPVDGPRRYGLRVSRIGFRSSGFFHWV